MVGFCVFWFVLLVFIALVRVVMRLCLLMNVFCIVCVILVDFLITSVVWLHNCLVACFYLGCFEADCCLVYSSYNSTCDPFTFLIFWYY